MSSGIGINDGPAGAVHSRHHPATESKTTASSKARMHALRTDVDDFSISSSFSPSEGLLQDPLFPSSDSTAEHPDEMQKKDPLATQIWRLYSRTKAQLPNQERMENLTWRMMAMSLKRKERESARQARYVNPRKDPRIYRHVQYLIFGAVYLAQSHRRRQVASVNYGSLTRWPSPMQLSITISQT